MGAVSRLSAADRIAESGSEHGRASLAGDSFIWGARRERAASDGRCVLQALPAGAATARGQRSRVLLGRAMARAVEAGRGYFLALSATSAKSEKTPSMPSA